MEPGSGADPDPGAGPTGPERVIVLGGDRVRIGRGTDNDVVMDDLTVSHRHAELRPRPGEGSGICYEIVDLHTDGGTYLNGGPVDRALVRDGDVIGIGHATFVLDGTRLAEFDDSAGVWLEVEGLVVTAADDGHRLLDSVSFPVPERCLVGVIGPSGAGKSTLLSALTGQLDVDEGRVLYDGRDLHRDYAELRHRIGVVPQQDILHVHLPLRRALGFAARLRFSRDTTADERDERVEAVIAALGIAGREEQRIVTLSGGQRKRVSVALELLTKPSLLLLDEPTSGLDPGMDRSMMMLLAELAHEGRTVIVVTHSVLNLQFCDRLLVLAPGGRVAYYGPPEQTLRFLGFDSWPEAFDAFQNDGARDWAGEYHGSEMHTGYVSGPGGRGEGDAMGAPERRLTVRRWIGLVRTLVTRYAAAIASDRTFLAIMAVLPIVLGAMARALAGGALDAEHTVNTVLIICVGAVLTGTANSVRELVKERPIYRRERAVGLPRSAYLTSKVLVLGTISVVQALVLTAVAVAGVDVDPRGFGGVWGQVRLELLIVAAALAFTAMMGGLVVSALVGREEVTMPLLVLIAIVQVIFCGALLPLYSIPGLAEVSWFVPARWALGAMAGTLHLQELLPGKFGEDPLFASDVGSWVMDVGILAALSVTAGGVVYWLLRRQEPAVMRRR
ncbi:ATP-binding cassette domain-containing protein [Tomitella cavernea]|uniref:FHA domain-containing protein n=1 Tax=Tomitella cavernea TaxID=1387982 RepID=A0ABP9CKB7_9ACTN|nr:ATP-binding cassette domain-containing protein [Tomitella cavernea]